MNDMPDPQKPSSVFLPYLILMCVIFFAFCPALGAMYLNWDDPGHFTRNPLVLAPSVQGILALFSHPDSVNHTYIPLTILSFVIEKKVFGLSPFFSHLINILLHTGVVWLVLVLGRRLGLSAMAAFVAALVFAVHPMRVESVVWVTERKDVLYAVFYLG
ncbi:MAG: hypothetical protein HQL19_05510, partial [Candidatus Omnitrophica bacterium]|nr:hypothetical protein [Candidatus Omnitrophota bacterium]